VLICWLLGHRYDYDIKKPELLALVCTRCGAMRILHEVRYESAKVKIEPRVEEKKS
jgi:hypothetical protein